MISKSIINACIAMAKNENKEDVIRELLKHIALQYDYNDQKTNHILEMLVDIKAFIIPEKVNLEWIKTKPELLKYQNEKYNIKNIVVDSIDNIDCTVRIKFDYLEKINEDRGDINYTSSYTDINFIDNPEILK